MFDLPPSFIAGLFIFSPGGDSWGGRRWALWGYGAFPNIQLVYLCIVVELIQVRWFLSTPYSLKTHRNYIQMEVNC